MYDLYGPVEVLWWRGLAKALQGDVGASKQLLIEARNKFEKIGATGYARQVESVMARTSPLNAREAMAVAW